MNLDILATHRGAPVGLELKYWSRRLELEVDGEPFALKEQGAQDLSRYDFWKDVRRLEQLRDAGHLQGGFVIALTNDQGFWRPGRGGANDEAFRMHEGREVAGSLAWSARAGRGTTRGREQSHELRGRYTTRWRDYSRPGGSLFRVLVLPIGD